MGSWIVSYLAGPNFPQPLPLLTIALSNLPLFIDIPGICAYKQITHLGFTVFKGNINSPPIQDSSKVSDKGGNTIWFCKRIRSLSTDYKRQEELRFSLSSGQLYGEKKNNTEHGGFKLLVVAINAFFFSILSELAYCSI